MTEYPITLDIIAQESERRKDDYAAFRYYVELDERPDSELDALVDDLATLIINAIDCTKCGNCCRSLDAYVTQQDTQRLSTATHISVDQLLSTIIDRDQAATVGEWGVFNQSPCPFLQNNNLCSVYDHRPDSCRTYPTFTPNFRYLIDDIIGGVGTCPIIYHLIECLQTELNW